MNSASIEAAIASLAKLQDSSGSLPSMVGELAEVLPRVAEAIEAGPKDRAALLRLREQLLKNQAMLAQAETLLRNWRAEFSFDTYDSSAKLQRGLG